MAAHRLLHFVFFRLQLIGREKGAIANNRDTELNNPSHASHCISPQGCAHARTERLVLVNLQCSQPGGCMALHGRQLHLRSLVRPVKSAWAFELADGTTCTFLGGATAAFEGKRVNYSCSDGWVILGELQEGQTWTAEKVRLSADLSSILESVQVFITKVWL